LEDEKYCENATTISNNKEIIRAIESNKNAIGFGSLIHKGKNKVISINGYLPSDDNISNDKYPLIRYLELYTRDTPSPQIANFIKWIQSKDGQKIVKQNGLIPTYKFSY
jgi:phosphate transport system substrate-binding protein